MHILKHTFNPSCNYSGLETANKLPNVTQEAATCRYASRRRLGFLRSPGATSGGIPGAPRAPLAQGLQEFTDLCEVFYGVDQGFISFTQVSGFFSARNLHLELPTILQVSFA